MSYQSTQLSPHASTHEFDTAGAFEDRWSYTIEKFADARFWRSWMELDLDIDEAAAHARINWHAVLGLVLVTGISVGFWAGVGLIVAHISR